MVEEALCHLDGVFSFGAGVDEEGEEFWVGEAACAEFDEAFAWAVVLWEVLDAGVHVVVVFGFSCVACCVIDCWWKFWLFGGDETSFIASGFF